MHLRLPLLLALALAVIWAPSALAAPPTLYVTDTGGNGALRAYAISGATLTPLPSLGVAGPGRAAATPDGRSIYVAGAAGISQFDVNPITGALTPKTPVLVATAAAQGIAVTADGRNAYATSNDVGEVLSFAIDPVSGRLTALGPSLSVPIPSRAIAATPDGTAVFAGASNAILQFTRDPATGLLTPKAPASVPATAGETSSVLDLRPSPDGVNLYATKAGPVSGAPVTFVYQYTVTPTGLTPRTPAFQAAGTCQASGLALGLEATTLYATCAGQGRVAVFPVTGGALGTSSLYTATTPALTPTLVQLSSDGVRLFAAAGTNIAHFTIAAGGAIASDNAIPITPGTPSALDVLVSPLQLITPALSATPAAAGSPTALTAGGSTVAPGAAIVRYDWTFGDGATLANGGPDPTHVYTAPGTYTAAVRMTASSGAYTGQSTLRNATATATTTVAVPPPTPGGGGGGGGTTLQPVVDRSLLAQAQRGRVVVRVPGSRTYVPLSQLRSVPIGSLIDARKGTVRITVAVDAQGTPQVADFYDGLFQVLQRAPKSWERRGSKTPKRITELVVRGELGPCPRVRARTSASAAATRKRRAPKTRRLWGSGKGDFSTKGKYSSATVRGTKWLVQDSCAGTLNRVTQGTVTVRDLKRLKTYIVKAGGRRLVRR